MSNRCSPSKLAVTAPRLAPVRIETQSTSTPQRLVGTSIQCINSELLGFSFEVVKAQVVEGKGFSDGVLNGLAD